MLIGKHVCTQRSRLAAFPSSQSGVRRPRSQHPTDDGGDIAPRRSRPRLMRHTDTSLEEAAAAEGHAVTMSAARAHSIAHATLISDAAHSSRARRASRTERTIATAEEQRLRRLVDVSDPNTADGIVARAPAASRARDTAAAAATIGSQLRSMFQSPRSLWATRGSRGAEDDGGESGSGYDTEDGAFFEYGQQAASLEELAQEGRSAAVRAVNLNVSVCLPDQLLSCRATRDQPGC